MKRKTDNDFLAVEEVIDEIRRMLSPSDDGCGAPEVGITLSNTTGWAAYYRGNDVDLAGYVDEGHADAFSAVLSLWGHLLVAKEHVEKGRIGRLARLVAQKYPCVCMRVFDLDKKRHKIVETVYDDGRIKVHLCQNAGERILVFEGMTHKESLEFEFKSNAIEGW